jgi:hypothetical protein
MSHFKNLVSHIASKNFIEIIGLTRQIARIRNGAGREPSDVLGFDYVVKGSDGTCLEFYAAEPPIVGMTEPVPVACPLGVIAFNGYKITYQDAIKLFHQANCGDYFVAMSLAWPLTHPESKEPFWHLRSNLGFDFVVGAISGRTDSDPAHAKYIGPVVVKYMGPNLKYMGPQS